MTKWTERRFNYEPPAGEFPMIVERLRGTPARVADRVLNRSQEELTRRSGESWSAQEHVGHLLDLEALWATRVWEFLSGAENLTAADMSNRKTYEARHNERAIAQIVAGFQVTRLGLVAKLDAALDADVARAAFHPVSSGRCV
jgi:hypothetical protein